MPPIEGNFEEKLKILSGGTAVEARGPLEWDKNAKSMSLHVAIMKEKVTAMGRTGDDLTPTAKGFVLQAAVQGTGKLKPGPAMATGLAIVSNHEGVEMYQWSMGVELVNGTS